MGLIYAQLEPTDTLRADMTKINKLNVNNIKGPLRLHQIRA